MEGGSVQFDNKADASLSPELIEFIKVHTGKMSSLAKSDLESFIMLNKQFLNIGKALHLEGMGTLVKSKEGILTFTAGDMVADKLDDLALESRRSSVFAEDNRYQPQKSNQRGWLLGIGALLTIGIIVYGGWRLSQSNSPAPENLQPTTASPDTVAVSRPDTGRLYTDTGLPAGGKDSLVLSTPSNSEWRFVIEETSNKTRAEKRYNQLREIGDKIQLDASDTSRYRLYFQLPAMPTDTARMRDSLRRFYGSRRVFVEAGQ